MAPAEVRCTSCGAVLSSAGSARFLCPSCGEGRIGRCAQCRDQSVPYRCGVCGFMGP